MSAKRKHLKSLGILALGFAGGIASQHIPQAAAAPALHEAAYQALNTFAEVYGHLMAEHVDAPEPAILLTGALRGLAGALDPHTVWLDPAAVQRFHEDGAGRFAGVGLEVAERDGRLVVVAPLPGTPAEAAGLRSGDHIVSVDGTPTRRLGLEGVISHLRGTEGTPVVIEVDRAGTARMKLSLKRAHITVNPVEFQTLEGGVGYIRLRIFQRDTAERLDAALAALGPVRGLVLDLRDNPGGLLAQAVEVAGRFVAGGRVVIVRARDDEDVWTAGARAAYTGPLVVLVNEGTASAAEILAGALQDHRRARLLGAPTFGKGTVQRLVNLSDGSGLKLTIARYFSPEGRPIDGVGLTPERVLTAPVEGWIEQARQEVKP
jgi:carboxyl-terminal processing protease